MAIENLEETFKDRAQWTVKPPERPVQDNPRAILKHEVRQQLWSALLCILYGDYKIPPEIEFAATGDAEEEYINLQIKCADTHITMSRYKELMDAFDPFVEELETVAGGSNLRFIASEGTVLLTVHHTIEELYDALFTLATDFYPDNHFAMAHLKNIRHLEERLCLERPACKLN